MEICKREHFTVNLVTPAIQTVTTVGAGLALGRLGHFAVSAAPSIAFQGAVAALISAVANNFFKEKSLYQYISIVASAAFSCVLLSGNGTNVAANAKPFVLVAAALMLVKVVEEVVYPKVKSWTEKKSETPAPAADDKKPAATDPQAADATKKTEK